MTIDEDRVLSRHEVETVTWLVKNASLKGPLDHLLGGIDELRVVGRCGCGCASVDFENNGQAGDNHPTPRPKAQTAEGAA